MIKLLVPVCILVEIAEPKVSMHARDLDLKQLDLRSRSPCVLLKTNLNGQIMYFHHSNNTIKSNEVIDSTRSRSKILQSRPCERDFTLNKYEHCLAIGTMESDICLVLACTPPARIFT